MIKKLIIFLSISLISFADNDTNKLGIKTVVIDAGHGGKDSGCLGKSHKEKDIALSIALKLGKYIEKNFKDVKVIYTRKDDRFVELYERARIANRNNADLFICIHLNANDNKNAYGTETYVMGLHKSEENLKVAQRENSSILLEDDYKTHYGNFDPNSPESYITMSLMQSAFLEQSLDFASKIQKEFQKYKRYDRGVKQAGFLVLYKTTMPSVLVETGFLTNPNEEKYLSSEKGQDSIAYAIFKAFTAYKEEIESKNQLIINSTNKEKNKNKQENTVNSKEEEKSVIFKVQFMTSKNSIDLKAENFNGLSEVEVYFAGGMYKYTYGHASTIEEAYKLQDEVKSKGFNDAFIVSFYNGKRIALTEAVKISKQTQQ